MTAWAAAAMVVALATWASPRLIPGRGTARHGWARHGWARHGCARRGTPRVGTSRHRVGPHGRPHRGRLTDAEQWAALLDSMSAEVRTGSSLSAATQHAVARHQPHGRLLHPTATIATLTTMAGTRAQPAGTDAGADADEAVVVQAICAAQSLGGPVASTLDTASALLRERAVIRSEAQAHSAQARLSARVLTGVPLVFAGWSLASSRSFRAALFSPVGLASAALGGLCNLVGWWWMRRIVTSATS